MSARSSDDLLARIQSLEEELSRAQEQLHQKDLYIETQVQRRAHVFDVILANLPDLICTFDLQGRFTYANLALLGVWQKTLPQIIGRNTFDLGYPPALAARIQQEVKTVIASGRAVVNHTPFTGAAGDTRIYEYIFSPVFDAERSGERVVEEVTCTARDITDRESLKSALSVSEAYLQQVFAQAPVAIVVFRGRDFVIELANPFYQAFLPGKELVGRPFAEVVPELGEEVWAILYKVFDTGEPYVAYEWKIPYDQNGDGVIEDVWFNVVYHPMRDHHGVVTGMVAVCSDVSSQVRSRQDLELANRRLEEFAYVASHDLQEPLRMVGIYSQLLLERSPQRDSEAEIFAGFIRDGVGRMDQLIRDLLDYSRVTHVDHFAEGVADLNASLAHALKTMEGRIVETHAHVVAGVLPAVRGETSQFALVFQNLLSNSLKYLREDVPLEIEVAAQRNGAHWIILMNDNGIGFDPQYSQKIFGLFKRLHKEEFPGTGLGLAICQRIVERYGGQISAEGRPHQGVTIRLSLPALAQD